MKTLRDIKYPKGFGKQRRKRLKRMISHSLEGLSFKEACKREEICYRHGQSLFYVCNLSTKTFFSFPSRVKGYTRAIASKIELLHSEGYSLKEVAEEIGCTRSYICKVIKRLDLNLSFNRYKEDSSNALSSQNSKPGWFSQGGHP